MDTVATLAATQTLTNKTLTAPVVATTDTLTNTGTLTLPTSTDTLVGRATTDTLTNKTYSVPNVSGVTQDDTLTWLLCYNSSTGAVYYRASTSIPKMVEAHYRHASDQSINNTTATVAKFDTTIASVSDLSYNASTGIFTVNTAGVYTVTATISFAANATGFRDIWFQVGGDSQHWGGVIVGTGGGNLTTLTTTVSRKFAVNDTFNIGVYQNSGGALNIVGSGSVGDDCTKIIITGILQA